MNFQKLSALAGVTVLVFGACTSNPPARFRGTRWQRRGSDPAGCLQEQEGHEHVGDPHLLAPPAPGHEHRADEHASSSRSRPPSTARRSATSRSSTPTLTTPRPPRTATGTARSSRSNANKAANDPDAMVYIGTYNSGAAKLSIPILNAACLVMVTPANTLPGPDEGRRRRHRAG